MVLRMAERCFHMNRSIDDVAHAGGKATRLMASADSSELALEPARIQLDRGLSRPYGSPDRGGLRNPLDIPPKQTDRDCQQHHIFHEECAIQ